MINLSPVLVNTLLLSEDHRYYEHSGLDFKAYLRVIYGVLTFNSGAKGGGSTITQQLAKNLFSTRGSELEGTLTKIGWACQTSNQQNQGMDNLRTTGKKFYQGGDHCHVS